MPIDEKILKEYEKLGIDPPTSVSHNVGPDNIRELMTRAVCTNWRLIGNQLHCDTDFGPFAQTIPTDYIMRGVDENNMPILTKVVL